MKEMKILSLADSVNMFLSLIKTPTFLDVFLHTSPFCLLKFKCSSLPVISFQSDTQYQYTCIFILAKIIVQCSGCKFPERVLLTGAISICKRFQKFHIGVKLNRMCGMSLLAIRFWVFALLLYSKRKSSITAPPPVTTKLITKPHGLQASETQRY